MDDTLTIDADGHAAHDHGEPCECGGTCATCTTAAATTATFVITPQFGASLRTALAMLTEPPADPAATPDGGPIVGDEPVAPVEPVEPPAPAADPAPAGDPIVVDPPVEPADGTPPVPPVDPPPADGTPDPAPVPTAAARQVTMSIAEFEALAAMSADERAALATLAPPESTSMAMIDPQNPGRFTAILCVEEEPTADGRVIAAGATAWRNPPLAMMLMTRTDDGHDGAVVAAVIENIKRQGAQIVGEGRFDTSDNGVEAARLVRDQVLTGVSIDGGDVSAEIVIDVDDNGDETYTIRITAITILGATIVPFPAIGSTQINYLTAGGSLRDIGKLSYCGMIKWMEPGEADGALPSIDALVAAGPRIFPAAYFDDPQFAAMTPIHVSQPDADGVCRVYGHLAPFGECHIGFGLCKMAPHSKTDYAYFKTGTVHTDGGARAVGTISLSTNHADQNMTAAQATAHYDHTGLAAAYVNIGEDAHGVWVSGVLTPGLSEDRATELCAASLSGDWRRIGGNLELVAALAVNVPGFPVMGIRDDEQVSLVAAGYGPSDQERQHIMGRIDREVAGVNDRCNQMEARLASAMDRFDRFQKIAGPAVRAHLAARLDALAASAAPPPVVDPVDADTIDAVGDVEQVPAPV